MRYGLPNGNERIAAAVFGIVAEDTKKKNEDKKLAKMDLQHDEPVESALVGGVRIRSILESVVRQIPCYHLKFSELHFIFNYRIFCSQINLSIYLSIYLSR